MPLTTIRYFAQPGRQTVIEFSPDEGITWVPVVHYDERPADVCREAEIDVPSGHIRSRYLLGNPELFEGPSNIIAVPEASGLMVALLALCALWGRRRAR